MNVEKLLFKLAHKYNFDLYGRYSMIARVIEANRTKPRLRILDVGGYNGQMAEFLPDDEVTIIDVFESDAPNYIKGDALHMPFGEAEYDVVVSADVFEHIPAKHRDDFMAESYRVSKDFVILAAPFDHPGAHEAEVRADALYKKYTGHGYIWLSEHLENGLPDPKATEDWLKRTSLNFIHIPNNSVEEWEAMITAFFAVDTHPSLKGEAIFRRANTKFNLSRNLSPSDEPSYRSIYAFGREPKTMPIFERAKSAGFIGDGLAKQILEAHEHSTGPAPVQLGQFWSALHGLGLSNSLNARRLAENERDLQNLTEQLNLAKTQMTQIKGYAQLRLRNKVIKLLGPSGPVVKKAFKGVRWLWRRRDYLIPTNLWWSLTTGLRKEDKIRYEGIQIQTPKSPRVSIVIPVLNEVHHTIRCLETLGRHRADMGFEIVVLDNGSSDATRRLISPIEGIVYVRSDHNLGFGDGCNRGVEESSGEIVVFLNNDTEVLDGWLNALVAGLDLPDAGLVGSKLVYPTGVLQEAGGVIFSDGSGWNYGRGGSPQGFEYNYVREVDYCSAASAAIRREVFDKLGGFDPRYSPAYYEDTDLAFGVRELGLKVYYEPRAGVVHYEGGTSGQDLTKGFKKHQVVNRDKFIAKWKEQLKHQWRDASDLLVARDRSTSRRVLIIEHLVPDPTNDSGAVRLTALITQLQELGYGVTLWPHDLQRPEPQTTALQSRGVEVVYGDIRFEEFADSRRDLYDAVMLSRADLAGIYLQACREFLSGAKLIFDTVDLAYLRVQRQAEVEHSPALAAASQRWRSVELAAANEADTTLVVSQDEARELRKEIDGPVEVVSNVHTLRSEGMPFEQRKGLVFIGNYNHQPNIDAVEWFCEQVLPLVHKQLPQVTMTILGSNVRPQVEALASKHVVVKGFVESVEPDFVSHRVFVSPLRYGAGVKGKIGQSIEYGMPVVTTPIGAEGMHLENGRDVLIATAAQDFADKVVKLYSDKRLWTELQKSSRETLMKHFSPEVARNVLAKVLDD